MLVDQSPYYPPGFVEETILFYEEGCPVCHSETHTDEEYNIYCTECNYYEPNKEAAV